MLDIFNIKNNKFERRDEEMSVTNILDNIHELFHQ